MYYRWLSNTLHPLKWFLWSTLTCVWMFSPLFSCDIIWSCDFHQAWPIGILSIVLSCTCKLSTLNEWQQILRFWKALNYWYKLQQHFLCYYTWNLLMTAYTYQIEKCRKQNFQKVVIFIITGAQQAMNVLIRVLLKLQIF